MHWSLCINELKYFQVPVGGGLGPFPLIRAWFHKKTSQLLKVEWTVIISNVTLLIEIAFPCLMNKIILPYLLNNYFVW